MITQLHRDATNTASGIAHASAARDPLRHGLLPYTRRHRRPFGFGLLFTVVLVLCRLALPLPLGAVVEQAQVSPAPHHQFAYLPGWVDALTLLAAGFVALALVAGMAEYFQRVAFANFANRTVNDVRSAATARVRSLDTHSPADLAAQVVVDSARVKTGLKGVLNHIVLNFLLVVGACAALAVTDARLGLVQSVGLMLLVGVALLGARRVAAVAADHRESEVLLGQAIHRFSAANPSERELADLHSLHELDAASGRADIDITRWEGRCTGVVHVILTATAAIVLVLGMRDAEAGRIDTGALFTVVGFLLVLHGPAVRLARQMARVGAVLVNARHLGLVLVQPAAIDPS